nr:GNAT family N-acetyltransferase [candidate division Zixibacteria bacterium]
MTAALIEYARKLGANRLILETSSRLRPAIGFYKKYGFKKKTPGKAERSKYRRLSLMMQLDLKSVVK